MELLPPMYQPYKYRLYPFRNQERELLRQQDELRFLWNYALEQRIDAWRLEKRSISYVDQNHSLTRWRNYDKGGLGRVYSHVAQDTLQRLDDAFKHFFRRCKSGEKPGYPRFKHEVTSLTYPDAYNGSAAIIEGRGGTKRLHLSKIGDIPIEVHREPTEGTVKTCTVERDGYRWFAVLTYEVPDPAPPPAMPPENPVGIDLGLTSLATLSTGEKVEPPKFLRKAEKRLKVAQRDLSRKVKGSVNWHEQKVRVQRCHAKVRDQRGDFAHKLTTGWANQYDLIAFEDMDLHGLTRTRMAKSILDAGWGMLRQMSGYKQRNRSHHYVEVPTKDTTQSCSQCGKPAVPHLELSDREFRSTACSHVMDRDINAAKNVVARALAIVGRGTPESTPVETGPPPPRKGRRVRSKKQEPPAVLEVAV
jgi:putative transposase